MITKIVFVRTAMFYGILSIIFAFGAQNLGAIFQLTMTCVGEP
jgi:hypothetical protein